MISIKQLNEKDIDLCYELDSKTISLWSKKQWVNVLNKKDIKVFGLLLRNLLIGICVCQLVVDEVQINFFAINKEFRKKGFGSYLMTHLIKQSKKLNKNKILLEVSKSNVIAEKFYNHFNFSTVGIRSKYYKDGSDALLKEKKIKNK